MTRYLIAYTAMLIGVTAIDAVWIALVMQHMFTTQLGALLAAQPRYEAAAAFYLIYPLGILVLAVAAGDRRQSVVIAARNGAMLGLCSYGTYELTNRATLAVWPLSIVLVDMAWGIFVTALGAVIGYAALQGRSARK